MVQVSSIKESIRERDGYRCVDCGRTQRGRRLDVHRLVPGRLGGEYTAKNCVTLCRRCHRKRHGREDPPRESVDLKPRVVFHPPQSLLDRLDAHVDSIRPGTDRTAVLCDAIMEYLDRHEKRPIDQ